MEKVHVEDDLCIGCGACVATCPDVFNFDDEGKANAIKDEVNDDVKLAADSCPTGAIKIENEN